MEATGDNCRAISVTGNVTVSGGRVTATTGEAIYSSGTVNVIGGLVFAYGSMLYGEGNVFDLASGYPSFGGTGLAISWDKAGSDMNYDSGSMDDIFITPVSADAVWAGQDGKGGITYSDSTNVNIGFISLDGVTVNMPPDAPNPPTLASITHNSVTLTAIPGYEYKLGNGAWQKNNTFGGLEAKTAYTFYQRRAETADLPPSAPSSGLSVTTSDGPFEITTASLPNATTGTIYNPVLTTNRTGTNVEWSILNGALPPGLELLTGEIFGWPGTAGVYYFTVHAVCGDESTSKAFVITVNGAEDAPQIATPISAFWPGNIAVVYLPVSLLTANDTPVTWSVSAGLLPPGLTFSRDNTTGITFITGTPTATGDYNFTLKATNSAGSDEEDFSISIDLRPQPTPEAVFKATGYDSGVLSNVKAGMVWYWADLSGNETGTRTDITAKTAAVTGIVDLTHHLHVIQPGDNITTAASLPQSFTLTRPVAPSGVDVKYASVGKNDGQIINVDSTMEYKQSTSTAWKSITGDTVKNLAPGTYHVRYKPNGTALASESTELLVAVNGATVIMPNFAPTVMSFVYDGTKKTAITANAEDRYTLGGTLSATKVGTYNVRATPKSGYQWPDGTTTAKMFPWSIDKQAAPGAPTGLAGEKPSYFGARDGKITGFGNVLIDGEKIAANKLEYADNEEFSNAVACPPNEITGLYRGSYYVRVKETGTVKAGSSANVIVPAGDGELDLKVNPQLTGELFHGQQLKELALTANPRVNDKPVAGTIAWVSPDDRPEVNSLPQQWMFRTRDGTYTQDGASPIKVNPATPQGEATITPVTSADNTLSDLNLLGSFINPFSGETVDGTLAWNDLSGTAVVQNKEYDWTFKPDDTKNYETVTGKFTPWSLPLESIDLDKHAMTLVLVDSATEKITASILPAGTNQTGLSWSSSDENVATVDPDGNITAVDIGDTIITARSAANPDIYGYCWVTVVKKAETPAYQFEIDSYSSLFFENAYQSNAYTLTGNKGAKTNLESFSGNVTFKSADSKVVKVSAVRNSKTEANVEFVGSGTTTITITGNDNNNHPDLYKKTATIAVTVNDVLPKLVATSLSYYEYAGLATFTVLPTDNLRNGVDPGGTPYNYFDGVTLIRNPRKITDTTYEKFRVEKASETSYTLYFTDKAPARNTKYTLYLQTTYGGKLVGEPFTLTVNYVKTTPKTTVKMPPALNTFWQEASGAITITTGANMPKIVGVELADTGKLSKGKLADGFVTQNFTLDATSFTVTPTGATVTVKANPAFASFTDTKKTKPAVKGILKVYFEGFGSTDSERDAFSAKVNVTVPIKATAPKLALTPATQTLNVAFDRTAEFKVTSGGAPVTIAKAEKTTAAANKAIDNFSVLPASKDTIQVTLVDDTMFAKNKKVVKASNALQFNVILDGAREDGSVKKILIKPVVKTATAVTYKLSPATVTFGKNADDEQFQVVRIMSSATNDRRLDLYGTDLVGEIDAKTEQKLLDRGAIIVGAATDNHKFRIGPDEFGVMVSAEASRFTDSYKLILYPFGKPPAGATAAEKKLYPALTLTIKVAGTALNATVKAEKGNIDLMNRAGTKLSYIPTIKNTQATIMDVTFEDGTKVFDGKLDLAWEDGKAVVKAKPGVNINKGEQFKVRLKFTLNDGNTAPTKVLTIKPAQSTVKHSIPKTTNIYQSRGMSVNKHMVSFDLTPTSPIGARIVSLSFKEEKASNLAKNKYANNPNNAYWFSFDPSSQQLHVWIRNAALVKPGKTTLIFSAVYEGQGLERYKDVNGKYVEIVAQTVPTDPKPPRMFDIKIPVNVVK